jgi:hypothetical protein
MFVRASLAVAFVLPLLALATRAAPALSTWYVDASAPAGGNGSQSNPFQAIQEGIDAAAAAGFDTVSVAPGTYVENIDFLNKRIAVVSQMGAHVTIIDGNQNDSVVRIVGPIDWGNDVKLVGFTVTNGIGGTYQGQDKLGGGILIGDASPLIEDCVITGNSGDLRGGGIYATSSSALVRNCRIENNDANNYGGGGLGGGVHSGTFWVASPNVTLDGCEIRNNSSIVYGGGVFGTTLVDCLVEDNLSSIGGGISQSTAVGCTIRDNKAISVDSSYDAGGGAADSTLTACILEDNLADTHGGGALNSTLVDCIVRRNIVRFNYDPLGSKGGGVYQCDLTGCAVYQNRLIYGLEGGFPPSWGGGSDGGTATRTTFYENGGDRGTGVYDTDLEHCVVFNHAGAGVDNAGKVHNSVVTSNWFQVQNSSNVTYSNIEGGHPGVGNIDAPPLFWAPNGAPSGEGHDFHLKAGSPCIDAGDPNSPLDPDGSIADMGVYPFDPSWCVAPVAYCTAKVNSAGCTPQIDYAGTPSLTSGFTVTASQVLNNKNGLLFWGSDPLAAPFQGGTKCVAAPTVRTPIQGSGGNPPPNDCSGTYSFSFDPAYMASKGLTPGQAVHAQYWSRDPQSPSTTGLTDALWFIICP